MGNGNVKNNVDVRTKTKRKRAALRKRSPDGNVKKKRETKTLTKTELENVEKNVKTIKKTPWVFPCKTKVSSVIVR